MKTLKRLRVNVIGICLIVGLTAFNANSQNNSSNNDDGVYYSPKNDTNKGTQQGQPGSNSYQPASGGGIDTTGSKMNNGNGGIDQNGNSNTYNNYYDEDDYGYTANLRRYYEPCYGCGYYDPWYSYPYYYGAGFYCGGYWGLGIGFYNPFWWGGLGYGWGYGGYYGYGHGYGYGHEGYGYGRSSYYGPRSSYATNGRYAESPVSRNGYNSTQSVERSNGNYYTNQALNSARSNNAMASSARVSNRVTAVSNNETGSLATARAHVNENAASNASQRSNVSNVPLRSANQGQRNNANISNGNRQNMNNASRNNGNNGQRANANSGDRKSTRLNSSHL